MVVFKAIFLASDRIYKQVNVEQGRDDLPLYCYSGFLKSYLEWPLKGVESTCYLKEIRFQSRVLMLNLLILSRLIDSQIFFNK